MSRTSTAGRVIIKRPGMTATSFATSSPLEEDLLREAPVRYPHPSTLAKQLVLDGAKAERAAAALGLQTVGDLLEHLPRDRRAARAVAELVPGESATVVVEVTKIASRSVRRRGMRPLVEATVADESGPMKATFFNQPWLVQRYPPGTRLLLHGKFEARNRFRVQAHATTTDAATGGEAVAHYPATDGLSSTQIHALVRTYAGAIADVPEPLPGLLRAAESLPDRAGALRAAHFPLTPRDLDAARERLAFEELLLLQLGLLLRRARRLETHAAPVLEGERELTARWLAEMLPFELTRDQLDALASIDRDLARPRPMQRLLMGEVGSGK